MLIKISSCSARHIFLLHVIPISKLSQLAILHFLHYKCIVKLLLSSYFSPRSSFFLDHSYRRTSCISQNTTKVQGFITIDIRGSVLKIILPLYEVVQTFKTLGNSSTVSEPEKRTSGSVKDSPLGGIFVRDSSFRGSSLRDSSNRDTILSDAPSSFTDTLRSDKSTVKSDTSSVAPTQAFVPVTTTGNDYDNIITTALLCSLKSFYLP